MSRCDLSCLVSLQGEDQTALSSTGEVPQSLAHLLSLSLTYLLAHSIVHPLTLLLTIYTPTCSLTGRLFHSLISSLPHLLIYPITGPLTYSLSLSPVMLTKCFFLSANQLPSYPIVDGVASSRPTGLIPESFLFRLSQKEEKRKGE